MLLAAGIFVAVSAMMSLRVKTKCDIAFLTTVAIEALHMALTLNKTLSLVTQHGSIWSNLPSEFVTAAAVYTFIVSAAMLAVSALNLALELPYVGKEFTPPSHAAHLCVDLVSAGFGSCTACTDASAGRVGGTTVNCAAFCAVTVAFMAAGLLAAVLLVVLLDRMAWRVMLQEHQILVLHQHLMAAAPAPLLPLAAKNRRRVLGG